LESLFDILCIDEMRGKSLEILEKIVDTVAYAFSSLIGDAPLKYFSTSLRSYSKKS
jgi:hypothetical protein